MHGNVDMSITSLKKDRKLSCRQKFKGQDVSKSAEAALICDRLDNNV